MAVLPPFSEFYGNSTVKQECMETSTWTEVSTSASLGLFLSR